MNSPSTSATQTNQEHQHTIQLTTPTHTTQLTQRTQALQLTTTNNNTDRDQKTSCLSRWFPAKETEIVTDIKYQHILNCQLITKNQKEPSIQITFLKTTHPEKLSVKLKTLTISGNLLRESTTPVDDDRVTEEIQTWIDALLIKSYPLFKGMPSTRSILIIINPASGSKKSLKIWSDIVEPILKSSRANYQVIFTTHAGHAAEIGEKMDLDQFQVVSCISGDGLIHEFLNGLGTRKTDFSRAINKIALTSIPAGSGNAFSTNHIGPKQAINIHLATLNLLKGRPTQIDLCSMTQLVGKEEGESETQSMVRRLSFLSVSFGLMADLDVGTEPLRWMGPTRFVLGFIWGAIRNRPHRIRLDLQLVQNDKQEIANTFYELRDNLKNQFVTSSHNQIVPKVDEDHVDQEDESFEPSSGLPKLKYGDVQTKITSSSTDHSIKKNLEEDDWISIETDVISLYAGILPFMSNDLLQFPAKIPVFDGSIHLTLHRPSSIWNSLGCLIGADTGQMFKKQTVDFYKVKAFRLTPLPRRPATATKMTASNTNTKVNNNPSTKPQDNNNVQNKTTPPPPEQQKSNHEKNNKVKDRCHIALDGESLPFRPLQLEIHNGLLQTLSLLDPDIDSPYFGSVGVPHCIL